MIEHAHKICGLESDDGQDRLGNAVRSHLTSINAARSAAQEHAPIIKKTNLLKKIALVHCGRLFDNSGFRVKLTRQLH